MTGTRLAVLAVLIAGGLMACTLDKTVTKPPGVNAAPDGTALEAIHPQQPGQPDAEGMDGNAVSGTAQGSAKDLEPSPVDREQGARARPIVPAFPEKRMQERVVGLKPVHFKFDSTGISADTQQVLRANAEWLKANPGVTLRLEGHCDERGTSEYNLGLGLRRAEKVREILREMGLSDSRFKTVTLGEEFPLRRGQGEAVYRINRRVEFVPIEGTALLER